MYGDSSYFPIIEKKTSQERKHYKSLGNVYNFSQISNPPFFTFGKQILTFDLNTDS